MSRALEVHNNASTMWLTLIVCYGMLQLSCKTIAPCPLPTKKENKRKKKKGKEIKDLDF